MGNNIRLGDFSIREIGLISIFRKSISPSLSIQSKWKVKKSPTRHPLPLPQQSRGKLIGVITIVARRLSRCHRLPLSLYHLFQPLSTAL